MDPATCSVCVLAGSTGGALVGFAAGRRAARPRARRARRDRLRTMRSWPGRRRPAHGAARSLRRR